MKIHGIIIVVGSLLAIGLVEAGTLYGNVGFWWQTDGETRNYFYAGAVLEREINARLRLGAELFGNSPIERGSRSDVAFNLGGTWAKSTSTCSSPVDATSLAIQTRSFTSDCSF